MADEHVNLFETPEEASAEQVPSSEEQATEVPQTPDLRGLGLLDYEAQMAGQAEASSPDQETQDGNSEQAGQTQETLKAKEDPGRMQYWQSQYDREKAEKEKLLKLAPDALKYAPLIEAIQTDQEVLNFIQGKVNNGTLGQAVGQQPQQNGSSAPVPGQAMPQGPPIKPTRPTQYDPAAAIHEAETDSYKYREAMEEYRDEMDEWRNSQEQVRYQQMQMAQQQQMQQSKVMENYNTLKHEYGATEDQIQTYNTWLNDPNTLSLQNLWRYHQYLNQPETQKKINKQKMEEQVSQANRAKEIPTTPTKVAGTPNPNLSDADMFNLGLLANNKKS